MDQTFENRAMLLKVSHSCQINTIRDLFMPATAQFELSNTIWGFIWNTKHYMLESLKMMPLTNNQTILKSPTKLQTTGFFSIFVYC